ncbi:hypothetical protein AtubIFM55763_009200 [Aspergillus tubingensis]|uniref:Proteinase inhibitor I78 n=4 Tax=Aspergillus subgen. Circumdati TaxID=2720871 RepID=A0A317V106_ASPEC|nr:uncharacterized protein BO83DRAFT_439492 [Aspergillus eucalypticola CBS 122712]XP_025544266.1 hypothetical protein BO79DRAFT_284068 [Aspergillus costaricaensis CBS 115574]XP_035359967.1 Tim44-like domain family protein [Aspergillus tubingensis]GAQ41483.1 similar to An08g01700 [Aspergillus niger]PWY67349.1 hypothetical protein BO83DRAFT_439492 [Aspergillus eucalypticola CBS 122712]RAK93431.1 hypothetical protein BO79DRAFT_284068 [Aspergillus costaricaensis CBS 115574]GFN19163.1 Tim44-like d
MPLVVPGINNTSGGASQEEWLNKLAGKKLTESSSDVTSFAKKDLPQQHRVLKPGDAKTMDMRPERMNIHLGDDGTVHDVTFG